MAVFFFLCPLTTKTKICIYLSIMFYLLNTKTIFIVAATTSAPSSWRQSARSATVCSAVCPSARRRLALRAMRCVQPFLFTTVIIWVILFATFLFCNLDCLDHFCNISFFTALIIWIILFCNIFYVAFLICDIHVYNIPFFCNSLFLQLSFFVTVHL